MIGVGSTTPLRSYYSLHPGIGQGRIWVFYYNTVYSFSMGNKNSKVENNFISPNHYKNQSQNTEFQ